MQLSEKTSLNGKVAKANSEQEPVATTNNMSSLANADLDTERSLVKAQVNTEVQSPTVQSPATGEVPKSKQPFKRPNKLVLAALGVGAITAGAFSWHWWQYSSTHESTDNATIVGEIHQISTRVPGVVTKVLVNDNQQVQPGQLLVQLDPADYQVKLQAAQAALETARRQALAAQSTIGLASQTAAAQTTQAQGNTNNAIAEISSAQAAVNEAQSGVPVAQAQLSSAQANLQKVEADYNRSATLFQSGAISRQQLDAARAAYDTGKAQVAIAQQSIQQARSKVAEAQENVAKAQAQLQTSQGGLQQANASGLQTEVNRRQAESAESAIAQAEATLKDAQLQLSYTNISAPVAGKVGRKSVEVGQRVQPGSPLMAIVGNEYWIVANFKETQLERMRVGQPVEIKLDAFPHQQFRGRIESLSPASGAQFALLPPDNATGNFTKFVQRIPVKIVFDANTIKGYENLITPGMSAEITVELQ